MSTMRYTIVDEGGTTSFVGPGHALKMLAAACSRHPADHRALLAIAEEYDPRFAAEVVKSLSRLETAPGANAEAGETSPPSPVPAEAPFRVVDETTRRQSLQPACLGLVVFNLPARRIVQVQNGYAELQRKDRGRLRRDGRPVRAYYSYELPADWSIVP